MRHFYIFLTLVLSSFSVFSQGYQFGIVQVSGYDFKIVLIPDFDASNTDMSDVGFTLVLPAGNADVVNHASMVVARTWTVQQYDATFLNGMGLGDGTKDVFLFNMPPGQTILSHTSGQQIDLVSFSISNSPTSGDMSFLSNSSPIATGAGGVLDSFYNSNIDNTTTQDYFSEYASGMDSFSFGASADFVVNTTDDTPDADINDNVCEDASGNCSLRAAIENANKNSDKSVIHFNIPGTAPFTIAVQANELPTIAYPVVIDARTQPEYATNNSPVIEIDGSALPLGSDGLKIYGLSDASEVYGLSIGGFQRENVTPFSGGIGIDVLTDDNIIQSNYIGLKPDGTTLNRNQWGIYFWNSANNQVGGTGANEGNVVSGNYSGGVTFDGANATGNLVEGNFLGTDPTGALSGYGNRFNLQLLNAPNNTIGGTIPEARNIISGGQNNQDATSDGTGISISGNGASGNVIVGNYIGTDISGTSSIANIRGGILLLFGANNNQIGGELSGEGNLISGNGSYGIYMQGSASGAPVTNNTIAGNFIGTTVSGNAALSNSIGIMMLTGENTSNTIGGTNVGARNIISGNSNTNLAINIGNSNVIKNNYIGVDVSATNSLSSTSNIGVSIGGNNNEIRDNVISGNGASGLLLLSQGTLNTVTGNLIGTNATGSSSIPNVTGVEINGAASNTVGGTIISERNIISGNTQYGINITGTNATGNEVLGNFIGTNSSGTTAIPNSKGVRLSNSQSNTINTNLISGNTTEGVLLTGSSTSNNVIVGNYIGTDVNGTSPLPNQRGIGLTSAINNTIGGTGANDGNVISGNSQDGLVFTIASGNTLYGNLIGLSSDGTSALPNGQGGIQIINGSLNNTIGGINPGEGNSIAYNANRGINMIKLPIPSYPDVEPTGNKISGNSIFENLTNLGDGSTGAGLDINGNGVTANDANDADTGANNTQNFPVIVNDAEINGTDITLTYSVDSDPANSTYPLSIEFFIDDTHRQGKEFLFVDTFTSTDFSNGTKTITMSVPAGSTFLAGQNVLSTATDANGNTSEFGVSVTVLDATLSLSEVEAEQGFIIYPNPATDVVFIKTSEDSLKSLEVFDLQGKRIVEKSTDLEMVSLKNFAKGAYLIKLHFENSEIVKRIVVE